MKDIEYDRLFSEISLEYPSIIDIIEMFELEPIMMNITIKKIKKILDEESYYDNNYISNSQTDVHDIIEVFRMPVEKLDLIGFDKIIDELKPHRVINVLRSEIINVYNVLMEEHNFSELKERLFKCHKALYRYMELKFPYEENPHYWV